MSSRRRSTAQAELQPVYVRPTFDRHERAAKRDFERAAYGDPRRAPKPGEFDPLWMRLGLRASKVDARAGWVVSNPLYDQSLRRNPTSDPSLPGPGWLMEVYRFHRYRALVLLPSVRAALDERERHFAPITTPPPSCAGAQLDLL